MASPSEKTKPRSFNDREFLIRLQVAAEEQRILTEAERERQKRLHWMHCPKCGHTLVAERYGETEVDVCPACKGLWLDAKELDAILASTRKSGFLRSLLKALGR